MSMSSFRPFATHKQAVSKILMEDCLPILFMRHECLHRMMEVATNWQFAGSTVAVKAGATGAAWHVCMH